MKTIYLDYAAATPMAPEVVTAMKPYLSQHFYNPSATYLAAQAVAQDIEAARQRVAHWIGARPTEVIFTAGGTEANNLAIQGIMQRYPKGNVVTSSIEHESVLKPAARYKHRLAGVSVSGIVDLEKLAKAITPKTVLVSIMYANNEVGTIQPLTKITKVLDQVRAERRQAGNSLPLYFHTDACQAAAYLDLHAARLGIDLMTVNAGKIYGPKQTGALYVRTGIELQPQILGGGQENGLRSGTENVANSIGFAAALDQVQTRRRAESDRLLKLRHLFVNLLESAVSDVKVNGSLKHRLPNNVHITIPGVDNERLMMQLDKAGIQCAVGSACSASNEEPSHVLKAIGMSDKAAQSSLRFSMGISTTEADIRKTVRTLQACLRA